MAGNAFGIDFGTSTIKVYERGKGIICNQRNMIAIENKSKVIAVGDDAFEMYEKTPASIMALYPVRNGVIADLAPMQTLFDHLFKQICGRRTPPSADFFVAVPSDVTQVEKRAFLDLIVNSKARPKTIRSVDKPIADAMGIGLDVTTAHGVMTVNIGADTTEVSIMSLGGIVVSKLVPVGGNQLDEAIQLHIKKKYNVVIGHKTAEVLKKELADAINEEEKSFVAYGRNVVTGLPVKTEISSSTVYPAIQDYLKNIVDSIHIILESAPPEIASDIIDSGIFVTGGSAHIHHLKDLIIRETELTVNISDEPEKTVISGVGRIIEDQAFASLASICK